MYRLRFQKGERGQENKFNTDTNDKHKQTTALIENIDVTVHKTSDADQSVPSALLQG
jgi:hypothetical protein